MLLLLFVCVCVCMMDRLEIMQTWTQKEMFLIAFLKYSSRTSGHSSINSQPGIFSRSEKIKDPRPLKDKSFIQQCIQKLYEVFYNLNCLIWVFFLSTFFSNPKFSMLHKNDCSFLQKMIMDIVYPSSLYKPHQLKIS